LAVELDRTIEIVVARPMSGRVRVDAKCFVIVITAGRQVASMPAQMSLAPSGHRRDHRGMRSGTTMLNLGVLLLIGILGCGTSTSGDAKTEPTPAAPAPAEPTSVDVAVDKLDGVESLRTMFNSDADKVRVIALLEPG
jgi:hypothetical protein